MNQSRWERLSAIYHAALEQPADTRLAFVDRACSDDPEMRAEIKSLLRHELPSLPAFAVLAAESNSITEQPVVPGTQIGIYSIERPLGAGGMGEVHLATDTRLNRPVALKFVSVTAGQDARRRFEQETRAISSLNHPHILTVHDSGRFAGREYLVTEFVDGGTLKTWLQEARRTWRQTVELLIGVADALAAAHDAGILHRDVKPANILVARNGYAKLADFGLAKLAGRLDQETRSDPHTAAGVVVGTLDYMSPEQLSGRAIDRRSDVFSFGVVLYEALSGHRPFAGATTLHVVEGILHQTPPPLAGDIPLPLRDIVAKALEKDPADRYQSMRELVVDLRRLVRHTTELPAAAASPNRLRRWSLAAALVALFLIAIAAMWWSGTGQAIDSIAVVPYAESDVNPETEYLSYGLIDHILGRLKDLSELRTVISHNAVLRYKTRLADAQTIGRELRVQAVLTVRLVSRNDTITVNLELVDASNGGRIWGKQYDKKSADLLALQQEIPVDVSENLRLRLSGEAKQRLARKYTENRDAYTLYVQGRQQWESWTQDGSRRARDYCQAAIDEDRDYALAYSCLADAYIFGPGVGLPAAEAHARGKAAAEKALQLDRTLGEPHAAWAQILVSEWKFSEAEAEFKEAIRLSPSYAASHHQYSHFLLLLGRIDESLVESKRYQDLDPVSPSPIGHLGYHYLYARDYDEAIRQLIVSLEMYPSDPGSYRLLGDAYAQKGMWSQAVDEYIAALELTDVASDKIAALKQAFAKSGMKGYLRKRIEQLDAGQQTSGQDAVNIAAFYARLLERERSFEWLGKAHAAHAAGLVRLKEELAFDPLRKDARFKALLKEVGLPQ